MLFTIDTRWVTNAPIMCIRFSLITRRVQIKWLNRYEPYSYTIRRRDQIKIAWYEHKHGRRSQSYGRLANWIKENDLS